MGWIGRIKLEKPPTRPNQTKSNQIKPPVGAHCGSREKVQNAQKVLWLRDLCEILRLFVGLMCMKPILPNSTKSD
jgi:hypothetical protein